MIAILKRVFLKKYCMTAENKKDSNLTANFVFVVRNN